MADQIGHLIGLPLEPLAPPALTFRSVAAVDSVLTHHLGIGALYLPALLSERMQRNPRLRGAVETRMNGLTSMTIRWEPARDTFEGRRALRGWLEDWRWAWPAPARRALRKSGLLLGVGIGQRVAIDSPTSKRRIFQLQTYWPGWATWDHRALGYRIQTDDRGEMFAPSPSYGRPMPTVSANGFVVHEPFGRQSFREAFITALADVWLGHDRALTALFRAAEKFGLGVIKVLYPKSSTDDDRKKVKELAANIRRMGREGVVPLERGDEASGNPGYDIQPFEFSNGSGFEVIGNALNVASIAMSILILSHNLVQEVKGGSYAAAAVGNDVSAMGRAHDGEVEFATLHPQLAQPWALENYGDPELAPIAHYVADPPAVNYQAAQTLQQLSLAFRELRTSCPEADIPAIAERFRIPLRALETTQVQAAAEPVGSAAEDPSGVADAPSDAVATPSPSPTSETAADATLALTPTHIAAIVKVDEGRRSLKLPNIGGDIGGKWIQEHASEIAAEAPLVDPVPSSGGDGETKRQEQSTP